MGRQRRQLNANGELYCRRGEHWVPIENFYIVNENAIWYIIDRIENGKEVTYSYGRPSGYCKECQRSQHRREDRDTGVQRVMAPARNWYDDIPTLTPEQIRQEEERLERTYGSPPTTP